MCVFICLEEEEEEEEWRVKSEESWNTYRKILERLNASVP